MPGPRAVIGAIVSLVCVLAVVWWMARQPTPEWPAAGQLYWIGIALLLDAANYVLRGWRWHRVMRLAEIPHSRGDAIALNVVGYMGNNVLPARGGELLRVGLLERRSGAPRWEIVGSIVAERTFDAAALVILFCAFTALGVAGNPAGEAPALIGAGGLVAGAGALAAYLAARRRGRLDRFAGRIRPLARGSRVVARPASAYLGAVSVFIWLLQAAAFICIGRSIGVELGALEGTAILVLGSILALVPAAPGYAGTFDAGIGLGLAAVGVTGGQAVGFVLLARFVIFVPVTIVGALLMLLRYRAERPSPKPHAGGI